MPAKKDIEMLKTKKSQEIQSIKTITSFVEKHLDKEISELIINQLQTRKDLLIENFNKLQDLHCEILCCEQGYADSIDNIREEYFDTLAKINSQLSKTVIQSNQLRRGLQKTRKETEYVATKGKRKVYKANVAHFL
ncbi:uncharacterized protein LOC126892638 [Diabrotica virgifera virgifera]|uniref:Uncharacterized protein n=1 Tax=Diabrotica virgifera virgifera TaxID=50390 RepID=A0ABM5L717_DIAVI|nr:uncharacterized protein LOC126892638 [Diabrotica virgifera virgifera]